MLKRCLCFVLTAGIILGGDLAHAEEYPTDISEIKAAFVIEQSSGAEVLGYNQAEALDTGGLARLPVLLAVCRKIDSGGAALTDRVTVSAAAAAQSGPTAFLEEYEQVEVSVLLKAAVMICAGDAIYALGEYVFGSADACAAAVNKTMSEMDIYAVFSDISGEGMLFSAQDMAKIGAELINCKAFALYSGLYYDSIMHSDGRTTELASSNKLLKSCVGTNGVGTGSSPEAGYCGIFSVKRGETGYICVVLGAGSSSVRAQRAQSMLEYAFAAFDIKRMVSEGEVFVEGIAVRGGICERVPLVAGNTVTVLMPKNAEPEEVLDIPELLEAPVGKNEIVGSITYRLNDRVIARADLVCAEAVDRATSFDYIIKSLLEWVHC